MNAYLPTLARVSEEVVKAKAELHAATGGADDHRHPSRTSAEGEDSQPLLSETGTTQADPSLRETYNTALSRATSRISSLGIALGYAAGILLLLVALVPVTLLHGTTFALRLAIGLSGIWWAVFSLPAAAWLPSTSTVSATESETEWADQEWSTKREIMKAWKRLGGMLRWREVKKLRNTFQYLAAWFLLSDGEFTLSMTYRFLTSVLGFTTITSTAVLFAKTSLNMPPTSLILIGTITPVAGIAGSLAWPALQRRCGWSNLRVLVTLVVLASLLPAYGCLGFLRPFREGTVKFGGLTTPGEMYVLAAYFGSVYGAFQGYARAFYSELIPHGEEARWYALFSITDKVIIYCHFCSSL